MTKVWIDRIVVLLVVSVMLFVVIKRYVFDGNKLSSNHRFTVATVYKIAYPAEGGPDADFQYCVNQVIYNNYISINMQSKKIKAGDKFLLKYYPPNPKIARILLDKPMNISFDSTMQIDTCR